MHYLLTWLKVFKLTLKYTIIIIIIIKNVKRRYALTFHRTTGLKAVTIVLYFSGAGFVSRPSGLMFIFFHSFHTGNCRYIKVKFSRYRPSVAMRVGRGIALLFHDRGTRMG